MRLSCAYCDTNDLLIASDIYELRPNNSNCLLKYNYICNRSPLFCCVSVDGKYNMYMWLGSKKDYSIDFNKDCCVNSFVLAYNFLLVNFHFRARLSKHITLLGLVRPLCLI